LGSQANKKVFTKVNTFFYCQEKTKCHYNAAQYLTTSTFPKPLNQGHAFGFLEGNKKIV